MNILLKYPTRSRPELFKNTLKIYQDKLSGLHEVHFVITCDTDDESMNNKDMISFLKKQRDLSYQFGNSRTKIQAINYGMDLIKFDWDICILVSDDMLPQEDGYDDIVASKMKEHYPDGDGVLHFNDGRVGTELNTLSIMGKKYYERFKYIYHPDYISLWCDNEFHTVSKRLKKVTYIDQVIIKHEWGNYVGKDALHKKNELFYRKDERTFNLRRRNAFPLWSVKR